MLRDHTKIQRRTLATNFQLPIHQPHQTFKMLKSEQSTSSRDILCGRGRALERSPGNLVFRSIINDFALGYANTKSRAEKTLIVKSIKEQLLDRNMRFLKFENDTWRELDNSEIKVKISHALRDVKKIKIRSNSPTCSLKTKQYTTSTLRDVKKIKIRCKSPTYSLKTKQYTTSTSNYHTASKESPIVTEPFPEDQYSIVSFDNNEVGFDKIEMLTSHQQDTLVDITIHNLWSGYAPTEIPIDPIEPIAFPIISSADWIEEEEVTFDPSIIDILVELSETDNLLSKLNPNFRSWWDVEKSARTHQL